MAENAILEGFICPICKSSLAGQNQLILHFRKEHEEDDDVLKSFLNFVSKATNKILNLDDDADTSPDCNLYERSGRKQEIGVTKSHSQSFKTMRSGQSKYFTGETNKLLIRLEKLLNRPKDLDRKQHEQSVVAWLDGRDVKLCPNCANPFNITRRQHHCRLCGTIMCHNCSRFISLDSARDILTTSMASSIAGETSMTTDFDSVRMCDYCRSLLIKRYTIDQQRQAKPPFKQIYLDLRQIIENIEPNIENYHKMHSNLISGAAHIDLPDVQLLRAKIAQSAEEIDNLSRKILLVSINMRDVKLLNSIRMSCVMFLKNNILVLPQVPTREKLAEMRKIASDPDDQVSKWTENWESDEYVSLGDSWTPINPERVRDDNSHPMLVQMDLIRGYIEQARSAQLFDEVTTLENHLKELQNEYFYNQEQK